MLLKIGHRFYYDLLIGQIGEGNKSNYRIHGVQWLTHFWSLSLRWFPSMLLWKESTGWGSGHCLEHHSWKICSNKFYVVDSESHSAKQHLSHSESLWGSWLYCSSHLWDRGRQGPLQVTFWVAGRGRAPELECLSFHGGSVWLSPS